jgi:Lon-like ATP-dependent protease
MDASLGMEGACIPWQNKHDVEPLLVNTTSEYIQNGHVPGIRIYREEDGKDPFDIYFCKTKYNAYQILMGLNQKDVEDKMIQRSRNDLDLMCNMKHKGHA